MLQKQQQQSDDEMNQRDNRTRLIDTLIKSVFSHAGKLAELDDAHVQHFTELASDHMLADKQAEMAEEQSDESDQGGSVGE